MTPIDQFKILKETFDHVTDMYDNAMTRAERAETELTVALAKWNGALERALKAEAELAGITSARPPIETFSDDALDIEYFRHLKEVENECLEQAIINGKGAQREADLLGKIERLERELAKVRYTKELNHINDSYEHEMQTFSKRPSNRTMTDVTL